jgi:hypothetical protein
MIYDGPERRSLWPIEVILRPLFRGTEETHDEPLSGQLVSRPRFQPGIPEHRCRVLPVHYHSSSLSRALPLRSDETAARHSTVPVGRGLEPCRSQACSVICHLLMGLHSTSLQTDCGAYAYLEGIVNALLLNK